jgi:ABC-type multidrug transport system fused ATPase/permease subunit
MPAILRRKIQYLCLSRLFNSSFGSVMNFRHGDLLNLLTVESTLSAKVVYSTFNLIFNLISIILISFLLIKISFQYAFILFIIMLPILIVSKYLLKIQSRISKVSPSGTYTNVYFKFPLSEN